MCVIGTRIRSRIEPLIGNGSGAPIANLRGLGAMLAFDVKKTVASAELDGARARALVAAALQEGLILLTCGSQGATIRVLVPLTIADADLDVALKVLTDVIGRS